MDVKELVEGYCQVTGRPTFTITVDEYIKFHQVALLNQPRVEKLSTSIKEQEAVREEKKLKDKSEPVDIKSNEIALDKEDVKASEKPLSIKEKSTTSIKKEEEIGKPSKINEEKPQKNDNKQVALNLLKSIQG